MAQRVAIQDPEPNPSWEMLPGESSKAYQAFRIYRDMDPEERSRHAAYRRHRGVEAALFEAEQEHDPAERSRKVAEVRRTYPSRASGRWQVWYFQWAWRERALAFDAEFERQHAARRARSRRELRERKVRFGQLLVARAIPRLNSIVPADLDLSEAVQLLTLGIKLESEGLGDSLDVPEGRGRGEARGELRRENSPIEGRARSARERRRVGEGLVDGVRNLPDDPPGQSGDRGRIRS